MNGAHPLDTLRGQSLQSLLGVSIGPTDGANTVIGKFGSAFRRWCKTVKKIEIPPCTWNMHFIGRGDNDKRNYPELDSNVKASHAKPILFFLAEIAKELSDLCPCPLAMGF